MKFCSHSFDAGLLEMTLSHHINNKYLALKVDQRKSKTTLLSQAGGSVVHQNFLMLGINQKNVREEKFCLVKEHNKNTSCFNNAAITWFVLYNGYV